MIYNTEKEMNNAADIILLGRPIDKFENRNHVNNYMGDGSLSEFYTIGKFKVEKVLKKTQSLNISKSDLFEIIEPAGVVQYFYGKYIMKADSYEPMEQNNTYIVYLGNNGMEGYSIINMVNGRFNLTNDESVNNSKHIRLKQEAIKKYSRELGYDVYDQ